MTDTDKILQALARLEAGQQAMQKDIKALQDGQKALQTDVKSLQADVKTLQTNVKALQEGEQTLQKIADQQGKVIMELREAQQTLELKAEAFHAEQTKVDREILTSFTNMSEINVKAIDIRVARIEKHLNPIRGRLNSHPWKSFSHKKYILRGKGACYRRKQDSVGWAYTQR
jgi:chromosome segregation ATPase